MSRNPEVAVRHTRQNVDVTADLSLRVAAIQQDPSLREQVASWLRTALFIGELGLGETFSVPGMAARLGVSATPVREAVLDLVRQGLVVAVPSKGFRVVNPAFETIMQTVEIRRMLEIPTTRRIAETITTEEIAPLRKLADEILLHAGDSDLHGFVEVDYRYHWQLTGLCRNPMLTELIEDLRSRARVHAVPYIVESGHLIDAAEQHHQLLDAMAARDMDEVVRLAEAHMGYAVAAEHWMSREDAPRPTAQR